jgi:hypothetical protein
MFPANLVLVARYNGCTVDQARAAIQKLAAMSSQFTSDEILDRVWSETKEKGICWVLLKTVDEL